MNASEKLYKELIDLSDSYNAKLNLSNFSDLNELDISSQFPSPIPLIKRLYDSSKIDNYYWEFCHIDVYKNTFKKRLSEYIELHDNVADISDFISHELIDLMNLHSDNSPEYIFGKSTNYIPETLGEFVIYSFNTRFIFDKDERLFLDILFMSYRKKLEILHRLKNLPSNKERYAALDDLLNVQHFNNQTLDKNELSKIKLIDLKKLYLNNNNKYVYIPGFIENIILKSKNHILDIVETCGVDRVYEFLEGLSSVPIEVLRDLIINEITKLSNENKNFNRSKFVNELPLKINELLSYEFVFDNYENIEIEIFPQEIASLATPLINNIFVQKLEKELQNIKSNIDSKPINSSDISVQKTNVNIDGNGFDHVGIINSTLDSIDSSNNEEYTIYNDSSKNKLIELNKLVVNDNNEYQYADGFLTEIIEKAENYIHDIADILAELEKDEFCENISHLQIDKREESLLDKINEVSSNLKHSDFSVLKSGLPNSINNVLSYDVVLKIHLGTTDSIDSKEIQNLSSPFVDHCYLYYLNIELQKIQDFKKRKTVTLSYETKQASYSLKNLFCEKYEDYEIFIEILINCKPQLLKKSNLVYEYVGTCKGCKGCVAKFFYALKLKKVLNVDVDRHTIADTLSACIKDYSITHSNVDSDSNSYDDNFKVCFDKKIDDLINNKQAK